MMNYIFALNSNVKSKRGFIFYFQAEYITITKTRVFISVFMVEEPEGKRPVAR
jgi:hypothetical protein